MAGITAKLTWEAVGTFALTFVGAASIIVTQWSGGQPGLIGIALAHGLVLSIAVSAAMNISGAQFNPAVTIALLFSRRMQPGIAAAYIVVQCAGAIAAGFLLSAIFSSLGASGAGVTGLQAIEAAQLGTPNFGSYISPGMAMTAEIAATFLLMMMIMGTAVDERKSSIGGFGIGLAVCCNILAIGPITGACMNPARILGTLVGGGSAVSGLWSQHWVYWVGPTIGALLAVFVYDVLIRPRNQA